MFEFITNPAIFIIALIIIAAIAIFIIKRVEARALSDIDRMLKVADSIDEINSRLKRSLRLYNSDVAL